MSIREVVVRPGLTVKSDVERMPFIIRRKASKRNNIIRIWSGNSSYLPWLDLSF